MRPRNGTCKGCGTPVTFAQSEDSGLMVLERHESAGGAGRYAIHDDGIARPVAARWEGLANSVHLCAGRERYEREG
jgi:hypothetical protein